MVGIIGAMAVEVESLLKEMTDKHEEHTSGITYYVGQIGGCDCVVAQSGVGKVAAAVCAQTMILKYRPKAVVNVGVAGGIGNDVHIGDIVISRALVQHDMDTSALGDPKGLISGLNIIEIPACEALVKKVAQTAEDIYGEGIHIGVIATGDQFIGRGDRFQKIADEFGASACEMEGGSIAQVCYMNHTDFVVIRAISDNADEEACVDFGTFVTASAHKTAVLIRRLIPQIA